VASELRASRKVAGVRVTAEFDGGPYIDLVVDNLAIDVINAEDPPSSRKELRTVLDAWAADNADIMPDLLASVGLRRI
jgi:hypothetical protein